MGNIEKVVTEALKIANDNKHGYAQDDRYGPNYDCSSLVAEVLRRGGYVCSRYLNTSTLPPALEKLGWVKITDDKDRQRGDIFGRKGKHVVMMIDKDNIVHASINEKGKITNGLSGDQTGKEICTRAFYIPDYKWEYHYRSPEVVARLKEEVEKIVETKKVISYEYYTVKVGDTLWGIATKLYGKGSYYTRILKLNELKTTVIVPNQKLKVKEIITEKEVEKPVKLDYQLLYSVEENDTLWKIATRYLGKGSRFKEIMVLNKMANTDIWKGLKLKIPFK